MDSQREILEKLSAETLRDMVADLQKALMAARSNITCLEIQIADRGESYAMVQAEIATLQSLVPVLNGECDICSCVPATQYTLCDEHWEKAQE